VLAYPDSTGKEGFKWLLFVLLLLLLLLLFYSADSGDVLHNLNMLLATGTKITPTCPLINREYQLTHVELYYDHKI